MPFDYNIVCIYTVNGRPDYHECFGVVIGPSYINPDTLVECYLLHPAPEDINRLMTIRISCLKVIDESVTTFFIRDALQRQHSAYACFAKKKKVQHVHADNQ